jgi:glucose-1-phosphate adenylyltransferase
VSGAHVERSIIAPGCYVSHDAHVTDSILFPGVRVGVGARLHRCIIDKNVVVPDWYRIGHEPDKDRELFTVSDTGIAVIEKDRKL